MGVGFFIFASFGATFLVSSLVHAFLSQMRLKVIVAAALLPCIVLFTTGGGPWNLYTILFGVSVVGSAIGATAAASLRGIQNRLGW
ncbi:hypothetical protein [Croceicoccus marinus]|uniref:hypothetical protein n=1 Tax=Croceicoccus marinus TaxID=450378 RepID=UPI0012F9E025|nr:hypothetical protein [Croceicoccus marinus]